MTVLISSLIFLVGGLTCQLLLLIRRLPGAALGSTVLFSAAILVGLVLVLPSGEPRATATLRVAVVYLGASILFMIATYVALRLHAGFKISLRRSAWLALPALIYAPSAMNLHGPPTLVLLVVVLSIYLLVIVKLAREEGWELDQILAAIRKRKEG